MPLIWNWSMSEKPPLDESTTQSQSQEKSVPFRGGGFLPTPKRIIGPLVFVGLILFWEYGSQNGIISPLVLPAPSEAWSAFMDLVNSGLLWQHLAASLQRLVIGWSTGTFLGIFIGTLIGLFSVARSGLSPLVSAIFPFRKSLFCLSLLSGSALAKVPRSRQLCSAPFFQLSLQHMAESTM